MWHVQASTPPPELLADEQGLHKAVDEEVAAMLAGRSSAELAEMQQQIESKMASGTAKVIEYWEAVMKRLKIAKAKVGERGWGWGWAGVWGRGGGWRGGHWMMALLMSA